MEKSIVSKAIISNRIYLDTTPETAQSIARALTYKIKKPPRPGISFGQFEIIKNYKMLPKGVMSIPSGRSDLIPEGYEVVDRRILHELPFPEPKLQLRPAQQPWYDEADDSCFLNALVGWGKTFWALYFARKLGQKTLIVCHNTMLRDQWIEEVKKLYGIPVGIIGSSEWDIDHTIVVGNIQTLTKNTGRISKEFGTVIVDECHHVTATTFTSFLDGMYARYKIGLSGTMVRKDGRHCMFKDFFGPKLYQPPQSDTMIPSVRVVKTGISLSPGDPWVEKINKLLYDPEYQMFIAKTAQFYMSKGHKVLVVADRVEFLQNVGELIGDECVCITGGTSKDDRPILRAQLESGEKSCVTGSRQIISEGWSVNILSCVILAAPIANDVLLEQVCGRVMREHEDKLDPIIVDMHFSGYADRAQNKLRLGFYMRKGWEVTNV